MFANDRVPNVASNVKKQLQERQDKQTYYYDQHVKSLPPLSSNDVVRYQNSTTWEPAVIVQKDSTPHSYHLTTTSNKSIRHNRRHLKQTLEPTPIITPSVDDDITVSVSKSSSSPQRDTTIVTERRTRSGRIIKPPLRYAKNFFCVFFGNCN